MACWVGRWMMFDIVNDVKWMNSQRPSYQWSSHAPDSDSQRSFLMMISIYKKDTSYWRTRINQCMMTCYHVSTRLGCLKDDIQLSYRRTIFYAPRAWLKAILSSQAWCLGWVRKRVWWRARTRRQRFWLEADNPDGGMSTFASCKTFVPRYISILGSNSVMHNSSHDPQCASNNVDIRVSMLPEGEELAYLYSRDTQPSLLQASELEQNQIQGKWSERMICLSTSSHALW